MIFYPGRQDGMPKLALYGDKALSKSILFVPCYARKTTARQTQRYHQLLQVQETEEKVLGMRLFFNPAKNAWNRNAIYSLHPAQT